MTAGTVHHQAEETPLSVSGTSAGDSPAVAVLDGEGASFASSEAGSATCRTAESCPSELSLIRPSAPIEIPSPWGCDGSANSPRRRNPGNV